MKAGIFALARGSMFAIAFVAMCWSATGFAFVPRIRTGSSFQEASGYVQRSWAFPDRVHPSSRRGCSALMALKDLARKAKENEVMKEMEALKEAEPDSPVFKILARAEAGEAVDVGDGQPEFPVSAVLRKNKGTLSVVAEYRTVLKSGFIDGILEPELLCPLFRNGGASAIAVATEKATGGCKLEQVEKIVQEQEKHRGDFPGPLPVIVRDLVLTEFQVGRAKAQGATGVTVGVSLVGEERCGELVAFCKRLGMEAVVQVTSQEEIEAAVRAGATVVSVVGKDAKDAIELYEHIPDSVLYKAGQMQAESAEAVIRAIRAKSSIKYHRPTGMSGKGEGAKEFLGILAQ